MQIFPVASFDRLVLHYNGTTSIVNCRLNFSYENKGVSNSFIEIKKTAEEKEAIAGKKEKQKKRV
ncbi:hypothetical protein BBEV_3255 [Salisediminibacterium beveridgei]|uniref:Uncharacterized protein n=1 Tax=Salisediminibacterium beveridgei TaxID=632773 RepID=A0A1D7R023_9BACI|nr:hypothetical protein BBEV_3255 [Salisediminibacterium beveridgei]